MTSREPFSTSPNPTSKAANSSGALPDAEATLQLVQDAASQFGIASIEPNLSACRSALAAPNDIAVAVVGGFKAGKSSLLNAVAGENLLPVGVLPLTSVVTLLQPGGTAQATVVFQDGRRETMPATEAHRFVAESENPENREGVVSVTIEYPALKKFSGLYFVDTPGLGSAFLHNTETSMRWLPNVGVAVLATSASQPMSEADLALLRDLRRHTPKIVIVVTKVDLLDAVELDRVLAFVAERACACTGGPVSVFPFSNRDGWEGTRRRFLDEVLIPLRARRTETSASILRHKILATLNECIGYLELGLAAAGRHERDKDHLREIIARERSGQEHFRRELLVAKRDWNDRIWAHVDGRTGKYFQEIGLRLESQFQGQVKQWHGLNLWKFSRAYEAWLQEELHWDMSVLNQKEDVAILQILEQLEADIARRVDGFRGRFALVLNEALGVRLQPAPWNGRISRPERPDVNVGWSFDIGIDLLWFLIPMSIFGPLIARNLKGKIPWEVRKAISRVSSQWADAIRKRMDELENQAAAFVNQDLTVIEKLLLEQSEQAAALTEAKARLRETQEAWKSL